MKPIPSAPPWVGSSPTHESFGTTLKIYNGKLDYGLLVRFLRTQVGDDWDSVYSEIISRIPTKLLDHREIIFWFVADKTKLIDGRPYDLKTNKYIWTPDLNEQEMDFKHIDFYVHPVTNLLIRVEDRPTKKETKNLDRNELKKYREKEKNHRRNRKNLKKELDNRIKTESERILAEDNKKIIEP